jgi:hypothetical protein
LLKNLPLQRLTAAMVKYDGDRHSLLVAHLRWTVFQINPGSRNIRGVNIIC